MTTAPPDAALETVSPPADEARRSVVDRARALSTSNVVLACIVAVGAALRLIRYVDNRSLWLDEAYLALNILGKSAGDLLGTLDYVQAAPPGFLLSEKAAVDVLGESEYALRLLPLVAGIASLPLFWAVARRFLAPWALVLAVGLFAVNEPLVYYSAEVKPYSLDVAVALVLTLLACRFVEAKPAERTRRLVLLGIAGVAGVWVSFPAVFVLAGIGAALLARPGTLRPPSRAAALVTVGAAWVVSFGGVYYMTSQNTSQVGDAVFGPSEGGPPSALGLRQDVHDAWGVVVDPFGFEHGLNGLAVLMFGFGVFALLRRRALVHLALLLVPLAAAFGAAVLDKYPLGGRFSLFLVPFGLIVVVRGVQELASSVQRPAIVAIPVAFFLLAPPVVDAARSALDPPAVEDTRPLLGYLVANAQPGDILDVYRYAQFALRLYDECDDCGAWDGAFPWPLRPASAAATQGQTPRALESAPPLFLVQQQSSRDQVLADLDELERLPRGKRIWFLFTHVHAYGGLNEEALYLAYLNRNGRLIDSRRTEGASLYLYELRP